MVKRIAVLLALFTLTLAITSIDGCQGLKEIKGNLSGQVVTASGQGIGYMSVALINAETGNEDQRQNAEGSGNFFFRDVKAGTYTIKLYDLSGNEIPTDAVQVKLGIGKTKTITVSMLANEE